MIDGMVWCEPVLGGKAKWIPMAECKVCQKPHRKQCKNYGVSKRTKERVQTA